MTRVQVAPEMLRWACERSGRDFEELAHRVPQIHAWVRGERQPTFKQLEKLATATRTPFGFLFLAEPPEERLPVPDFRTVGRASQVRPSPDLLDTVHGMQRRQEWLRECLIDSDVEPLSFAGSARLTATPAIATSIQVSPSAAFLRTRRSRCGTTQAAGNGSRTGPETPGTHRRAALRRRSGTGAPRLRRRRLDPRRPAPGRPRGPEPKRSPR